MRTLRQLGRRKLRTALTVLGITIGIWALVVFSSMANKINALVDGGSEYYTGKVMVTDASNVAVGIGLAPMTEETAEEIAGLPEVGAAVGQVQLIYDPEAGASFASTTTILGQVAGEDAGYETFDIGVTTGRLLEADDEGSAVVVLGADLARSEDAAVGDTLDIRGTPFEVVGILEPTLTAPDTTALVPLAAAQELFTETLPAPVRAAIPADRLLTQVIAYPAPGIDEATLAAAIEASVDSVGTMTGADFTEQVGSATAIFNAIIIGVAAISLIVGGLSVINTMAMAVAERTREIGIKRAIGGSRLRVVRELVTEAGAIGFVGGFIGLALGAAVVLAANEAGRDSGTVLFDLTLGTAAFAVAFSTILGMLAGIIPAWSAARLDPVAALRYE